MLFGAADCFFGFDRIEPSSDFYYKVVRETYATRLVYCRACARVDYHARALARATNALRERLHDKRRGIRHE